MTDRAMRVGLAATKAAWSTQLRSYIHDHVAGLTVDAVLDPGQLNQPGRPRLDVLVIDDATRLLTGADIGAAVAAGTLVVGLYNPRHRSGRDTLERLGVSHLYSVETPHPTWPPPSPPSDRSSPAHPPTRTTTTPDRVPPPLTLARSVDGHVGRHRRIWTHRNGHRHRQPVGRDPTHPGHRSQPHGRHHGRPTTTAHRVRAVWALGLAAQGQADLPRRAHPLTGPEGRGLGDFDVICQSSMPGAPAPASPTHLEAVVDAALSVYDHVLVEIGPLVLESTPSLDRFAAGRAMLTKADQAIVVARSDPEAVIHLAEWKAAARTLAVGAQCWAVFGRTPKGNYELSQLTASLQATTASDAGSFAGIRSLPEDPQVAKARWNAEMVGRSRWLSAIERLARDLATPTVMRASPLRHRSPSST